MSKKDTYLMVIKLINNDKVDRAIKICLNSEISKEYDLIGKIIKKMLDEGYFDEAELLGESPLFKDIVCIQLPIIKSLNLGGQNKKVLDICLNEKFDLNPDINGFKIKCLTELGRYKEAEAIGNNKYFLDEPAVQIQLIKCYFKQEKMDKIEEIATRSKLQKHEGIKMELIRYYLLVGRIKDAEKILQTSKFKNSKSLEKFYNKTYGELKSKPYDKQKYEKILNYIERMRVTLYKLLQSNDKLEREKAQMLWDKTDMILDKLNKPKKDNIYILSLYNKYFG